MFFLEIVKDFVQIEKLIDHFSSFRPVFSADKLEFLEIGFLYQ